MKSPNETPSAETKITLRISATTAALVENASATTGLKKSDVIRLGLDRGVPLVEAQLAGKGLTKRKPAPTR